MLSTVRRMDTPEDPEPLPDPDPPALDPLTDDEVAEFRRLWKQLRHDLGLPPHLSDPDAIAAVRRAIAGLAAPRRKRNG